MVLGVKVSVRQTESLQINEMHIARGVRLAKSEGIKEVVNQVAEQVAIAVMRALRIQSWDPKWPQWGIEGHKDRGTVGQYL